jgi:hypothetical protein
LEFRGRQFPTLARPRLRILTRTTLRRTFVAKPAKKSSQSRTIRLPRERAAGLGTSYHSISSALPQRSANEVVMQQTVEIESYSAALDRHFTHQAGLQPDRVDCCRWWPSKIENPCC